MSNTLDNCIAQGLSKQKTDRILFACTDKEKEIIADGADLCGGVKLAEFIRASILYSMNML